MQLHGKWKRLWILIGFSLLVTIPISIWETASRRQAENETSVATTSPLVRMKREANHNIDHHGPEDNAWWAIAKTMTRRVTNSSCVVCSIIPHSIPTSPLLLPAPATLTETLAVFLAIVSNIAQVRRVYPWTSSVKIGPIRKPGHFSTQTNDTCVKSGTIHQFRGQDHPYLTPEICIFQPYDMGVPLGISKGCKIVLKSSCSGMRPCDDLKPYAAQDDPGIPNLVLLNFTAFPNGSRFNGNNSGEIITTGWASIPSMNGYGCPKNMVWVCGYRSYLYLPVNWSGICYLAHLVPALSFFQDADEIPKRNLLHRLKRQRISKSRAVAGALFAPYGTTITVREINKMSFELENLTALVEKGFSSLSEEMQAVRTMLLQNRIALDFVLAEKGGVCHIIGEQCCTFVPDVSNNMSNIHVELSKLLNRQKEENSGSSWNMWDWFGSGGWTAWLSKLGMFFGMIFMILMLLSCCIIPMVKSLVQRLISTSFVRINAECSTLEPAALASDDTVSVVQEDSFYED
uniref:Envelope protein n=1 Tax=Poecilia reticulata TaxID=8081 RepID=A0A3P9MRV6_POERE